MTPRFSRPSCRRACCSCRRSAASVITGRRIPPTPTSSPARRCLPKPAGACWLTERLCFVHCLAWPVMKPWQFAIIAAHPHAIRAGSAGILLPMTFKSGDLVVLKSGGPTMTVDTVNTDIFDDNKITGVLCAWFVGDKFERVRFDHGAIQPAALQG